MTHPSPHPGTPTPPPGPSRINPAAQFASFMDFDGRLARSVAAETAGSYGRSAEPMGHRRRIRSYWLQNGHQNAVTPRQRRRAQQKLNRQIGR